jgi:hypothetical protein
MAAAFVAVLLSLTGVTLGVPAPAVAAAGTSGLVDEAAFSFPPLVGGDHQGQTVYLDDTAPIFDVGIYPAYKHGTQFNVSLEGSGRTTFDMFVQSVDGRPITAGFYDDESAVSRHLDLSFDDDSLACGNYGTQNISDIAFDAAGNITRLAMSFSESCSYLQPLFGEIRYHEPAGAATLRPSPASIDFGREEPSSTVARFPVKLTNTSRAAASIASLTAPAPFTISAGTCPSTPIAPGSSCTVTISQKTTATQYGRFSGNAVISFRGGLAPTTIALYGIGRAGPTQLTIESMPGDVIGLGQSHVIEPATGYQAAIGGDATRLDVRMYGNVQQLDFWDFEIDAPAGQNFRPGVTYSTQRASFQQPGFAGLDVSGQSRGCNDSTGTFFIKKYTLGYDGLSSADIYFRQTCGGEKSGLVGEFRYNAGVPDPIEASYARAGGPRSTLGLPISLETVAPAGGKYTMFQHGTIYWTAGTGAHVVTALFFPTYVALNGVRGTLGYPTSDPYVVYGGQVIDFQHGHLIYNPLTHRITLSR